LKYLHSDEKEQFIFEQRGYVDMKGKGNCLTYFLNGATNHNKYCRHSAIEKLSEKVTDMLESKKWKRQRYFPQNNSFISSLSSGTCSSLSVHNQIDSVATDTDQLHNSIWDIDQYIHDDIKAKSNSETKESNDDMEQSVDELDTMLDVLDNILEIQSRPKRTLPKFQIETLREEQVEKIYVIMLPALLHCFQQKVQTSTTIAENENLKMNLMNYIEHISLHYHIENRSHNFECTTQALIRCDYLYKYVATSDTNTNHTCLDEHSWYHFILLWTTLIKDWKHTGQTDEELIQQKHPIATYCGSTTDLQYRYSLQTSTDLLIDEFPYLYHTIIGTCPNFLHHVRNSLLQRTIHVPPSINFHKETIPKKREILLQVILGLTDAEYCV
jgi:hypothetical protein